MVGYWCGYLSGARCRLVYGPLPLAVSCFSKIQIGFSPFWYRLTRVVLDRGPFNGCVAWWTYVEAGGRALSIVEHAAEFQLALVQSFVDVAECRVQVTDALVNGHVRRRAAQCRQLVSRLTTLGYRPTRRRQVGFDRLHQQQ